MIDPLVQVGLSNLLLSAVLGALAYGVHRRGRYPALAHLLWVLVLVKVVTPPLLSIPLSLGPGIAEPVIVGVDAAIPSVAGAAVVMTGPGAIAAGLLEHGPTVFVVTWLVGSLLALAISVARIRRFGRLLGQTSAEAPVGIQEVAGVVARQLGLRSAPTVHQSDARLSPMTWWTGGRLRIVLPATLLREAGDDQLRWVLAHELAHIKRHDHLVRWVEWLACVAFWWNPVVWWARRNLRLDEEDACDALVLERMGGQPRAYAKTLLDVVELVVSPPAPAVATGIDAAGSLERRFTKIISPVQRRRAPRSLVVGVMGVMLVLMSVGIGGASGGETEADRTWRASAGPDDTAWPGAELNALIAAPTDPDRYAQVSADLREPTAVDTFSGTPKADTYSGSGRDEIIVGRAGADMLSGGGGRDLIRGGKGADIIRGGAGRDTIKAGAGNDVVKTWQDGVTDRVDCGRGNKDRAVVDSTDVTVRCEKVVVREP